ncbi:MAG: SulP family inorganic anion transporter [Rikenellaceae bacterium]
MINLLKNIWYRPILLEQLKTYNRNLFFKDLLSGIIVGVVALPLGIAFGIASGVTPEKGIISCIIAGFFCSLLGGSKFQISGPTGALIVIVSGVIGQFGLEGLFIATFISGIFLLLMGIFKVGSIIKFIPYPIVIGFTSGIAVTIFSTQIKDFFGLNITTVPTGFIQKWGVYFNSIDSINIYAVISATATILLIRAFIKISPRIPSFLTTIVIISAANYVLRYHFGINLIQTIGDKFIIDASLPSAQDLGITFDKVKSLFSAGLTIAIFGAIVTLLSSTVADGLKSESHNPNTELVGQGVANMISPIFGGIPVTGAIARTITNISNGVRTPIAGIINAIVLLLILLLLGNLSQHIPMACLAGILVLISYNMSDWRTFVSLLRMPRADVVVLVTTFLLTVIFDLTIAIEVGLLLAVISFVRRTSEASSVSVITHKTDLSQSSIVDEDVIDVPKNIEIYEIEGPFFFGVANKFNDVKKHLGTIKTHTRIIRMRKVPFIDSTGIHNLEILYKNSKNEKVNIILSGVNPSVLDSLTKSGFTNLIGENNIFPDINSALSSLK